jgi:hypothetical protein
MASSSRDIQLKFDGIFKGKENEIRITPDKMISVFDFIRVVGGQSQPDKTWKNVLKNHNEEVRIFYTNFKFQGQGQKLTPVINVKGMVKLLFWLPGEMAKQFRAKSAETMIRYLGGDLTLIDEIKKIDNHHMTNPNNIAQIFREEVQQNQILFSQDEINNSRRLLEHFGPKGNVFYMLVFKYLEEQYAKTGVVRDSRQLHTRYGEHQNEFGEVCLYLVIQCSDINTVENEFKQTSFFRTNKVTNIPRKYSKKNKPSFHTEILKLSELVTTETIKEKMKFVAGDRITDPPPVYKEQDNSSLEIERERTKQIQEHEKTKQMEIQLKMMELQSKQDQKIKEEKETRCEEPIIQETEEIQEEQPEKIQETHCEELELSKNSKVFLIDIVKSYSKTSKFSQIYSSGYNNYHGFSKDFKDHVELDIKNKFQLSAIKNNGKIYYIGLKYKNCTSFYNHQVYQQFVDKFVYLPESSIKLKKIPPGKFMYKVESDKLYSTFCIFTKNLPSIYEKLCSSGHTILYKKEFIEMICSICDVKPPSYTSKTVKYFNGICLK